jgi:hypothetical protein
MLSCCVHLVASERLPSESEGHQQLYDLAPGLNPKFATADAVRACELRVRGTRPLAQRDETTAPIAHVDLYNARPDLYGIHIFKGFLPSRFLTGFDPILENAAQSGRASCEMASCFTITNVKIAWKGCSNS